MRADLGRDLPGLADLREILDQHQDRQAALHLELAVDAGSWPSPAPRSRDRCATISIAPAAQVLAHLLQRTWRANKAPGRWRRPRTRCGCAARGARRQQRRHDGVAEMLERHLVAEEERLVGRHRLDHFDGRAARRPAPAASRRGRVRLNRPALRATGSSRLSTRYCLSADSTRPERVLQQLAQIIVIVRAS